MRTRHYFLIGLTLILTNFHSIKAQSQDYTPPSLPTIPNKVFNINDYGAISNNTTDNTLSIQNAIDAAIKAGGGRVVIPAGVYLSGPLKFSSNLNLQIDSAATVRFLPFNRYPGGLKEGISFISGTGLHDIAITGKGTIDGQGSPWWPYAKTKDARRPRMIVFRDCDRILIEHVTLTNSPMFHIAISGKTSNVTVSGIIVRAPASDDPVNPSHNTDACDVTGKKILIKNCDISTGDDDYTCGGGTSDVLITNCKYGYGHGVSIGSPTKGGVSNITVENCTFTNTECGIRLKSDRDRGGLVQNLTYRNLKMTNVGIPILIYGTYNAKDRDYRNLQKLTPEIATTYPSAPIAEKTPIFQNITFSNIKATVQPGKRAGLIWGLPEAPVDNVLLKNVEITAENPFGIFFTKNVRLQNCRIRTKFGTNALSITNSEITIDGKAVK
ncbi:MAG: glycosyl hydrolase family 28 protein [Paludibacter sp.]|nr:glycosyl hydrolase family 28 protein [Paludibacter sp.]